MAHLYILFCVPGTPYHLPRGASTVPRRSSCSALTFCFPFLSAFGPLIAAGILGGMEGLRGYRAWHWLFMIEGAATIFVGFLTIFVSRWRPRCFFLYAYS